MKIRTDFVTNSSSSSFIISTNQQIPEKYENLLDIINKDNVLEILMREHEFDSVSYYTDDSLLMELAGLTQEQLILAKLAINGKLETYKKIMDKAEKSEKIYTIKGADWDWLYYQDELKNIISKSEVLYSEDY